MRHGIWCGTIGMYTGTYSDLGHSIRENYKLYFNNTDGSTEYIHFTIECIAEITPVDHYPYGRYSSNNVEFEL